jgi:hypothetical protein
VSVFQFLWLESDIVPCLRFGRVTSWFWTGFEKLDHFSLVKCYVML